MTAQPTTHADRRVGQDVEADRLAVVYDLLAEDQPATAELEALTRLAVTVCGAPVEASISLVDDELQLQLATSYGAVGSVAREESLCELMITTGSVLCLPDASVDDRYADNPHVDGRHGRIRFYTSVPLVVADQVVGSLCAFASAAHTLSAGQLDQLQDVATVVSAHLALQRRVAHLQRQVIKDPLTGVGNRNILDDAMGRFFSRGRRGLTQPGIVYVDLNHFKQVNDTYGHEAGDEVLRQTARRLLDTVREADLVIRVGGDEFVVLVDESPDLAEAQRGMSELSDRIRAQLAAPVVIDGELILQVSAAVGWAMDQHGHDDAADLLHRADLAMYADKPVLGAGRGRSR